MKRLMVVILSLLFAAPLWAEEIRLRVYMDEDRPARAVAFLNHTDRSFESDEQGLIVINGLDSGQHIVTVFVEGYETYTLQVDANGTTEEIPVRLEPLTKELSAIEVKDSKATGTGMSYLKYIEVDGLYAAKKNEIILVDEMPVNRSNNSSRQLFAKVPGINVQETDAGGLQMGVGSRGLNPKRTTNFNTRQDGYDISADALGYPESYYTPPIEAVEQVELVRGAASLQYGTQFGGLLNFRMKRGVEDRPVEVVARQTVGSYGFIGSFASVGGTAGEWNYYGYYQHKEGNGWRPNSHFNANGGYAQIGRNLGEKWSIDLALTHYYYLAKQPGGLTDRMFEEDPSQSIRERNWFQVNWNVAAVTINGQLTKNLTLNSKTFLVKAERGALGFLGNITRIDTLGDRDLILGEFFNVGNETRLIQRFNIRSNPGAVLVGARLYRGDTRNRQGKAGGFDGPDFDFLNPDYLEGSDLRFPSQNVALFSEVLIPISGCWYVTPGLRYEYIRTENSGYYLMENRHPLTNAVLHSEQVESNSSNPRSLLLAGIGTTYRCFEEAELYGNISQNYRAINFSDIRVVNPNLVVDSNLTDEYGYTVDFGFKGKFLKDALVIDASAFMMMYRNRIGEVLMRIDDRSVKRVRTNIADARFLGVELFEELDVIQLFKKESSWKLSWYNNIALVDARYLQSEETAFEGKRVENVPAINYRTGLSLRKDRFGAGCQLSHVSDQYTDATNTEFFADATAGVIPAYTVMDLSVNYTWKRLTLEGSINNLTDRIYYTRRATGYPGPGIIPAERRMFFMTLQVKI